MKVEEFAEKTTFHGVNSAVNSTNKVQKSFWTVCILAMFAVYLQCCTTLLRTYFTYPSSTSIATEYKPYQLLPSISLCNVNAVRNSTLVEKYPLAVHNFISIVVKENPSAVITSDNLKRANLLQYLHEVSFSKEESYVECFKGHMIINCSEHTEGLNTEYGFCLTFNLNDTIYEAGYTNNILLLMDFVKDEDFMTTTFGRGYLVAIHEKNVKPLIQRKFVLASVGMETAIALTKRVTKRLSQPYTSLPCIDTEQEKNKLYSQSECLLNCFNRESLEEPCECQLAPEGNTSCTLHHLFTCAKRDVEYPTSEVIRCNCYPPCIEIEYETHVSTIQMPNNMMSSFAQSENWKYKTEADIRENYVAISVYFQSLDETVYTQTELMDWGTITANIGGQLGLFLGASSLTLIELIEFLVFCVKRRFRRVQPDEIPKGWEENKKI